MDKYRIQEIARTLVDNNYNIKDTSIQYGIDESIIQNIFQFMEKRDKKTGIKSIIITNNNNITLNKTELYNRINNITEEDTKEKRHIIIGMSDYHFGAEYGQSFNLQIAQERAKSYCNQLVKWLYYYNLIYDIQHIYIIALGDMVDGTNAFSSQHVATPVSEQITLAASAISEMVYSVRYITDINTPITFIGVPGNHGMVNGRALDETNNYDCSAYEQTRVTIDKLNNVYSYSFNELVMLEKSCQAAIKIANKIHLFHHGNDTLTGSNGPWASMLSRIRNISNNCPIKCITDTVYIPNQQTNYVHFGHAHVEGEVREGNSIAFVYPTLENRNGYTSKRLFSTTNASQKVTIFNDEGMYVGKQVFIL